MNARPIGWHRYLNGSLTSDSTVNTSIKTKKTGQWTLSLMFPDHEPLAKVYSRLAFQTENLFNPKFCKIFRPKCSVSKGIRLVSFWHWPSWSTASHCLPSSPRLYPWPTWFMSRFGHHHDDCGVHISWTVT